MATALGERFDLPLREAVDHFESQGGQEALGALSGACRTVALTLNKIAGDVRLLGSGPASGLGEVVVPDLQAGSSIMPGKVNPVIMEVVQQIVGTGRRQRRGDHVRVDERHAAADDGDAGDGAQPAGEHRPVRTRGDTARRQGNRPARSEPSRMREHALRSPSLVTALAPFIGYDRAAVIAKTMVATGATIEQAGRRELGDEAWDKLAVYVAPERMAHPA